MFVGLLLFWLLMFNLVDGVMVGVVKLIVINFVVLIVDWVMVESVIYILFILFVLGKFYWMSLI